MRDLLNVYIVGFRVWKSAVEMQIESFGGGAQNLLLHMILSEWWVAFMNVRLQKSDGDDFVGQETGQSHISILVASGWV